MKKFDPFSDSKSDLNALSESGDISNNVENSGQEKRKAAHWTSNDDSRIGWAKEDSGGERSFDERTASGNSNKVLWILIGLIATSFVTLISWFLIAPSKPSPDKLQQSTIANVNTESLDRSPSDKSKEHPEETSVNNCYEKKYNETLLAAIADLKKGGRSQVEINALPEQELVSTGLRRLIMDECRRGNPQIDEKELNQSSNARPSIIQPKVGDDRPVSSAGTVASQHARSREEAQQSDSDKNSRRVQFEQERRVLEEKLRAQELARLSSEKRQKELEAEIEKEKRLAAEESVRKLKEQAQERDVALARAKELKEKLESETNAREQALDKERLRNIELERELKEQGKSSRPPKTPDQKLVERSDVVCPSAPQPQIPVGLKVQSGRIRATASVKQGYGVVDVKINESNMPKEFEELIIATMKKYSCFVRNGTEGETWREFIFKP